MLRVQPPHTLAWRSTSAAGSQIVKGDRPQNAWLRRRTSGKKNCTNAASGADRATDQNVRLPCGRGAAESSETARHFVGHADVGTETRTRFDPEPGRVKGGGAKRGCEKKQPERHPKTCLT